MNFPKSPAPKPEIDNYEFMDSKSAYSSIVDRINEESSKHNDDFYKENYHEPELTIEEEEQEIIKDEVIPEKKIPSPREMSLAAATSDRLIKSVFKTSGFILGTWSKCDPKELMPDENSISEVAEYFAPYLAVSNVNMPDWAFGLFFLSLTLGEQFKEASKLRKQNMELEAEKQKNKDLLNELDTLKKEQEVYNLKTEIAEIKKNIKSE